MLGSWEASGQSLAAFCTARGIHPERLKRWSQRLDGRAATQVPRKAREHKRGVVADGFVEAAITGGSERCAAVVMQVGDAVRIEVVDPHRVDVGWLLKLASALAQGGR